MLMTLPIVTNSKFWIKELSSWILKSSPSCLWGHFTYFRMCVNSSQDQLGNRLESPESHQELQHQRPGRSGTRRCQQPRKGGAAQETIEDMGCLVGCPVPIKGKTGIINLGRRDFLLFRCWPVSHESLFLFYQENTVL